MGYKQSLIGFLWPRQNAYVLWSKPSTILKIMSTKDTSTRLGDIGPYTLGLDTCRSLECKGPKAEDMRT
jgi:hypothetical protein